MTEGKKSTAPAVSVIISIRNCADYIAECLESLVAQTFKDFEVIVVLDDPTDRTPEIVESFRKRLDMKIFRNEKRMGKAWNLNRAWAESTGEFIAQVDGDDVILPRKLEIQLAHMRRHPELGFTGTMGKFFGAKEGKIPAPRTTLNCRFWLLWCESPFLHSSAMFRREIFIKAGVKYNTEFSRVEDFRFFMDAVFAGIKFANIHRDFYRWRIHPENGFTKNAEDFESERRTNAFFILEKLGLPASDATLALHRQIAGMNVPDTPEEISTVLDWLGKIAVCDCGKLGISRCALAWMLRIRWAVVVFKNCVRHRSPHRGLYFQKANGFDPLGIWRVPLRVVSWFF